MEPPGERADLGTAAAHHPISSLTLVFTWVVSIPIGIYSATHQYSIFDYSFTFVGFIGLATPNFLLALVLMFCASTSASP